MMCVYTPSITQLYKIQSVCMAETINNRHKDKKIYIDLCSTGAPNFITLNAGSLFNLFSYSCLMDLEY